jgi:hypothetical protein
VKNNAPYTEFVVADVGNREKMSVAQEYLPGYLTAILKKLIDFQAVGDYFNF